MVAKRRTLSISVLVFFVAIITFPFYVFSSGGAQISSIFFLLLSMLAIDQTNKKFISNFNNVVFYYYFFILYAILIAICWFLITLKFVFFGFIVFYIFNLFVLFGVVFFLTKNEVFYKIFPKIIAFSVVVQFILSLVVGNGESLRDSLFFNNPNQLGYYALISAAILVIFFKKKNISGYWFYPAILCTLWLAQLSLSNATLISILLLFSYAVFSNLKTFLFAVFAIFLLSLIILDTQDLFSDRTDIILDRFSTIGEGDDDSLAGRGYDRIWNHPFITLVGGGEGAVYRWKSFLSESEIHSSWGTLLFSYGLIGFSLFMLFLKNIVYSERFITFVPFLVIGLYGITHNGLRFVYFWIFLAVCVALKLRKE
ncbi:MAG TPA: hypothetical protein DC010_10355 [Psychrobacter sp.]|nr:hypothetical protein [Psychrobacter sp.]